MKIRWVVIILAVCLMAVLVGCKSDKPSEQATEQADVGGDTEIIWVVQYNPATRTVMPVPIVVPGSR